MSIVPLDTSSRHSLKDMWYVFPTKKSSVTLLESLQMTGVHYPPSSTMNPKSVNMQLYVIWNIKLPDTRSLPPNSHTMPYILNMCTIVQHIFVWINSRVRFVSLWTHWAVIIWLPESLQILNHTTHKVWIKLRLTWIKALLMLFQSCLGYCSPSLLYCCCCHHY